MKKVFVYLSAVALFGALMTSCRSHGGDCPAYGKIHTQSMKAQNI